MYKIRFVNKRFGLIIAIFWVSTLSLSCKTSSQAAHFAIEGLPLNSNLEQTVKLLGEPVERVSKGRHETLKYSSEAGDFYAATFEFRNKFLLSAGGKTLAYKNQRIPSGDKKANVLKILGPPLSENTRIESGESHEFTEIGYRFPGVSELVITFRGDEMVSVYAEL